MPTGARKRVTRSLKRDPVCSKRGPRIRLWGSKNPLGPPGLEQCLPGLEKEKCSKQAFRGHFWRAAGELGRDRKRALGVLGENCTKQAFRGYFWRAAGQLAGTWKRAPGGTWANQCSKQVFRGHVWRAAKELAETWKRTLGASWANKCSKHSYRAPSGRKNVPNKSSE